MSEGIKVVTIGGGSSYTPELVEGFIKRFDELPVRELWLVDIEAGREKLEIIGALAKRMVAKSGVPMEIHSSLDRREALIDADFVTTQICVGQLGARVLDERIPAKHGMIGQETNGAGGVFKALRTVPVIYAIIKDMKELCPEAWMINFTNPAGIVSEAVFRYADFERYIGVCSEPHKITKHFAATLGVKAKDVVPYFAGLNHMSYALNVYNKGKDQLPFILEDMKKKQTVINAENSFDFDATFVGELGVYPSPYHKYFYHYEEMYELYIKNYNEKSTRAEQVKEIEHSLFEKYKDENLDIKPQELEKRGGAFYSDVACSVIDSIYNDRREYHVVNTINDGYITDLPDGCAIEITCRITKHGPIPVYIGKLPLEIKGLITTMKTFEEVLVDAIYERNLNKAKLALQINPLTRSITKASACFDELVIANREHLNYYFEE